MIIIRQQFRNIVCILTIVIATYTNVFSQDATSMLLEGTIGKAAVIMEITINGTEVSGQYYYKRIKRSIPLEGTYSKEGIELIYEHWDEKEKFLLKNSGTGTAALYSGTWINETAKAPLKVSLKPLDVSTIAVRNSYVKQAKLSEYDYARLADVVFKQDSIQVLNSECSITWLRDTISNFKAFRINKSNTIKGSDSINYFLEGLQYSELLSYLDCLGEGYESEIAGVYVRGHVLSFFLSASYDCGGAHPDFGITGYTFNMDTGTRMELTDFLFFGKTKVDYSSGNDYKLGSEVMGPNIVKLLTKLYPSDMKGATEENGDCDYSDVDSWNFPSWYLTKEGLYLYSYFYRAARNCDGADFSTIPYNVLTRYKNPKVNPPMKY